MSNAAAAWPAAGGPHDGAAGADMEGWIDRKMRAMRLGLFGVLHVMNRDAATSWRSFVLFAFIDFNQMLNFVFNSSQTLALPWKGTVVAWVAQYLTFFKFSIVLVEASSLFFPLFFLVVLTYVVVSGLVAMAGRSFLQHRFQHLWVLHFLRWWARFSISVLYLPFQDILFTGFACTSGEGGAVVHSIDPTVTCWEGFHIVVALAGVLGLFLQVGFSAVIALMFVDRDPTSLSPDAAPHGRVALFNVASKAILNFVVVAVGDRNVWLLVIVFVLVGVSQVALSLGLLPYFSVRANQLTTVFAAIFAWGTCSLLVALLDPGTGAAATVFFVGSPLVAFVASSSVTARYHAIARTPVPALRSPLLVEVKLRHVLSLVATEDEARAAAESRTGAQGTGDYGPEDGAQGADGGEVMDDDDEDDDVDKEDEDDEDEDEDEDEEGASLLLSADSAPALSKAASHTGRHRRHRRRRRKRDRRNEGRRRGADAVLLSEAAMPGAAPPGGRAAVLRRATRQLWPVDADRGLMDPVEIAKARISWRVVEGVYRAAQRRFPHATVLHMYLAVVYDTFAQSEELALEEVQSIERAKHSYLDERYFAFARRRRVLDRAGSGATEDEEGEDDLAGPVSLDQGPAAGNASNDPIRFITFEHHVNETKRSAQMARMVQVAFWNELKGTEPDLNKLFDIGSRLHRYIRATHRHFREVIKLKGGSPDMLRLYASFLVDVVNDREQSERLVKRAAQLEAARTKDLASSLAAAAEGGPGPNAVTEGTTLSVDAMLDPLDERNAVITVASSPQRRGVVTAANAAAERLTGYSRHELVGRNVSTVVPEPFASAHDQYLQRYEQTGTHVIVGTTRPVFARHASGALNLVHLSVQEGSAASTSGPHAAGGADTAPDRIFIGVMQPIVDRSQHALVDAEGVLRGCTLGCAAMFGAPLEDVGRGDMHVTVWLPDFYSPAFATAARSASGAVLHLPLYLPHYFSPDRLSLFDLLQLQLLVPSSEARALGVDDGLSEAESSGDGGFDAGRRGGPPACRDAPSLRRGSLLRWFLNERPGHEATGPGASHVAAFAARSTAAPAVEQRVDTGEEEEEEGGEGGVPGVPEEEQAVVPPEEGVHVDRVWCGIPLVRARVPVFVHIHDMSGGGVRASTLTFRPLVASYEAAHGGHESEGVVSDPDSVSLSTSASASASALAGARGIGSQESLARVVAASSGVSAAPQGEGAAQAQARTASPFATANVAARLLASKRPAHTGSPSAAASALARQSGGSPSGAAPAPPAGLQHRWQQARAASHLSASAGGDASQRGYSGSLSSRAQLSSMAPVAMTMAARGRMLRGSFLQGRSQADSAGGSGSVNDSEAGGRPRIPGPPSRSSAADAGRAPSLDSGQGLPAASPTTAGSEYTTPKSASAVSGSSADAPGAAAQGASRASLGAREDRMARVARRLTSKSLHALHEVVRRLNSERDRAVVALEMALRLVTVALLLLAVALVAAQHGTLAAQRSAATAAVTHDERAEHLYGVACRCHDADIARRNVPTIEAGVALQNETRPFLAESLVGLRQRQGALGDVFLAAQSLAVTEAVESAAARAAGAVRAQRDFNGTAEVPLESLARDVPARAAVLEVVNKAELVLEAALGALMPLRTAIFFVVHNVQWALRVAMEHGAAAAREEVSWATGVARAAALLSGALLLPAVVAAAAVLFAAVTGVERAKDRILTLFVDIPHRTTLRIYMRCVAAQEAHRGDMASRDKALAQLAQELDTGHDDAAAHLHRNKGKSGSPRKRGRRSKRRLRRRRSRRPSQAAQERNTPGSGRDDLNTSSAIRGGDNATIHSAAARLSGRALGGDAVARPGHASARGGSDGSSDSNGGSGGSSSGGGDKKAKGHGMRRMSLRFHAGREEREELVAEAARAAADHEATTRRRIRSPAARAAERAAGTGAGQASPEQGCVSSPDGTQEDTEQATRASPPSRDSGLSGGGGGGLPRGRAASGMPRAAGGRRVHPPRGSTSSRFGFRPSRLDADSLRRGVEEESGTGSSTQHDTHSASSPTDDSTSGSRSSHESGLSLASLASEEQKLYMRRAEKQYQRHQRRAWLRLRLLPSQKLSGSILRGASKGSADASASPLRGKTAEQQRLLKMLTPKQSRRAQALPSPPESPSASASDSSSTAPAPRRTSHSATLGSANTSIAAFRSRPAAGQGKGGDKRGSKTQDTAPGSAHQGRRRLRLRLRGSEGPEAGEGAGGAESRSRRKMYARTQSLTATLDWVGRGASVLTEMRGRRHFVKRSGGLTSAMLRVFAVLVALAVFALVNTLSALETAGEVESLAQTALAASERARRSQGLQLRLRRQVDMAQGGNEDASAYAEATDQVVASVRELRELQQALLYGSARWGTLPPSDPLLSDRQFALELRDACPFVEAGRRQECRSLARSVLANGLHAAVAEALDSAWRVAASDQRRLELDEAWAAAPLALARHLDMRFLGNLLRLAASMHLEALGERMQRQVVLSWTLVTVLVAVQVVLHAVVSRQLLRRVEDDLRHARSMLLMIPGDVARRIPSVRQYIREATMAARRRAEQSHSGRGRGRRSSRVFNTQDQADLMPSVWSTVKAYTRLRGQDRAR